VPSGPLSLSDLFPRDRICVDIASVDKEALFVELVDLIGSTGSTHFDREDALACVLERESRMSTGIRPGVALPHGKTDGVDRFFGVIGVSRLGVDYDALDGEPVRIAFMLISPRSMANEHLAILKRLAGLLDAPGFVAAMLSASDPSEAHRVIERYEARITKV